MFLARSTARTHQYDSDNSNAEDDVPDTRRTSVPRKPVKETNIEKDVDEEEASQSSTADDSSSYCPSNGDESDSIESQSDTQEMDQHPSPYDMRSRKHANLPDLSLDNTIKSTFPVGSKNARRKRERMNLRLQKTAAHIQRRCDDTEQEILSKASSNGSLPSNATDMDVDEHVTPLSSANQPITTATATLPKHPPANPPPPPKSNAPQMKRNFTTNDFFDALESAIQHAQSNGNTIAFNNNTDEQDERSKEINPEVPITPYMKQIVGSIMSEIDTVVAYRMIFTVDYIKHVHQYWQSRMNIPVDKRPRMTLKTAAAFLRNDSLYIDKCRVIDMNNGREDFGSTGDLSYSNPQTSGVKTMVQFNCKFNSLCAEDQEEADRKRKPFRPFNEIELRADVDEYCIFTILWACDPSYNSDACTNAALADNANAYDQAPMGNIIVYWHSCQFGFRANASVQV